MSRGNKNIRVSQMRKHLNVGRKITLSSSFNLKYTLFIWWMDFFLMLVISFILLPYTPEQIMSVSKPGRVNFCECFSHYRFKAIKQ